MKHLVIIACLLFYFGASAQSITMHIGNAQLSGSQIIYDVSVEDFTEIVAMQYSISYDSNVLSLASIDAIVIPTMTSANFDASPGSIVNVWFESSLNGVTLADNSVIYKLVFDVLTAGDGKVCFSLEPREPEALQGEETLLDIYVTDDCHDTPFLFHDAMTAVVDLFALSGITVNNIAKAGEITINVQESRLLNFSLTDMQGKVIATFPERIYNPGQQILKSESSVTLGIYLLVLKNLNQISSTRVLFIE
jgi:hypothetical protein